jgi:transposase-like protein
MGEAFRAYLATRRWPDGVVCPRCGNEEVYPATGRPFHWQCTRCAAAGGYRFSVLVHTIFENTNVGLRQWFKVIYLMLTSKKGISSLQIQRMMGFGSYRTALNMSHCIRSAVTDPKFREMMGIVEGDETLAGKHNNSRHVRKWTDLPGTESKAIVKGASRR